MIKDSTYIDNIKIAPDKLKSGWVRIWMGTDVLTLIKYPPSSNKMWYLRLFARRILHKHFDHLFFQHWVDGDNLKETLIGFGIDESKIVKYHSAINCDNCKEKCKPISHNGFNVVYFRAPSSAWNRKLKDWIYGYDIIEILKFRFPTLNWIELDYSKDLCSIYRITDMYLRPNRWDGGVPRSIRECQILGIPYYWSEDLNPDIAEISIWILRQMRTKDEKPTD